MGLTLETSEMGVTLNISEMNIILELGGCPGTVSLGETFRVTATITDLDGTPVTGAGPTQAIILYNPAGTAVTTENAPTEVGAGVWYQNFTVPAAGAVGVWRVFWWCTTVAGAVGIAKISVSVDDP